MKPFLIGVGYGVAVQIANPEIGITEIRWWVAMLIICFIDPVISHFMAPA